MDQNKVKQELYIMISHYIRDKNPDVYSKLRDFFIQNHIFSQGDQDISSILDNRYPDFPENQFLLFLKTLTPKDDYPSLFRRMTPFSKPSLFSAQKCHLDLLCATQFHTDSIFSIEIDPLSRFLVTGSDDKTMKIISLPFFKEVLPLEGHEDVISNIFINYDISLLLSSSHDSTVRVWSLNNGRCLSVLSNITTSDIHYALFSPNGQLIAAACEDGSLFVWKTEDALENKPPFYQVKSPELTPIVWLTFSPGSEFLCYVAEPNRVNVLSLSTNKTFELRPLSGNITYAIFSRRHYPCPQGNAPKIVTFSAEEGTLSVFSVRNSTFSLQHVFRPSTSTKKGKICAFSWDYDDHLAVVVRYNSIVVYDTISGKTVSQLPEIDVVSGCYLLAANPKFPSLYAFFSEGGVFTVWDIYEIELLASYTEKNDQLFHEIKWSPDGRFIISSDNIGRVLILCFTMNGHKCSLINVSPSANNISSCFKNGVYYLNYQVKTDLTFAMKCHDDEIELVNRLEVTDQSVPTSPSRSHPIVVQQLPDPISVVNHRPFNPTVLKPGDDPSLFKNVNNDEENYQPSINTNSNEEADVEKPIDENSNNDDLDNIAFNSDTELTPILPPNDPSHYNIYEPFLVLNKPSWAIATSSDVFVPQEGDQVLFVYSAYKFDIISCNTSDFAFPPLLRCQIKKIHMEIENIECFLIIDLEAPFLTSSLEFQIQYKFDEFCDYLFLISAMAAYVQPIRNFESGQNVEFRADGFRCSGELVSIRKDYKTNPFESISVSGIDSTINISPWQILKYNDTEIINPFKEINRTINYEVVSKTIDSVANKPEYARFYDMSCEINQKDSEIPFPIDMKFIVERTTKGWYRTSISLQNDIEKLMDEAKIIFDDQPDLINLCKDLCSQCFDLIKRNVIRIE